MRHIKVKSIAELDSVLPPSEGGWIFRGQSQWHHDPSRQTNFVPSMRRHGCVPPLMAKWTWIAKELLLRMNVQEDLLFSERELFASGLMQHYGWRSFHIDMTSNAAVAAWFAGTSLSYFTQLRMVEDYNEDPLILKVNTVRVDRVDAAGHIFAAPAEELARCGNLVDLRPSGMPRPITQSAWFWEPTEQHPPIEVACQGAIHIEAPAECLREYAKRCGYWNLESMFPPMSHDELYRALMFWPWAPLNGCDVKELPIFHHPLNLPHYQPEQKLAAWDMDAMYHLPPEVGFLGDYWIIEQNGGISFDASIRVEDMAFAMTHADVPLTIAPILTWMNSIGAKRVLIEHERPFRSMDMPFDQYYSKGALLERVGEVYSVREVYLRIAGRHLFEVGGVYPLHYTVDGDGRPLRIAMPGDCTCNNSRRHELLLRFLHVVGDFLASGELEAVDTQTLSMRSCRLSQGSAQLSV